MKHKNTLIIVIALALAYVGNAIQTPSTVSKNSENGSDAIYIAYTNKQSDIILTTQGTVSKLLADDNKGSRHQKFIVNISSTHSILIAHNIDLAPRINTLKVGDHIKIKGEYEWNAKGGVIHWTHHDPRGKHPGGWLKHQGKTYE